ncbi:AraC family transcriptional regulator [Chlorogloeopsis sp. ULAP01]|uniref:AraC family transcriptional regulator n=1 Tax=Chlorogloeopsis sp. ULAP01 TaxID=3056483 RepID=UPI0025AA35E7|nr:AraC family transcriptional regulator [Chlorogloeopsis sp. ULAP01]MDM9379436.1 AraC family transcriptional regulator [Chlorogloeopsis sp. ULAP01]
MSNADINKVMMKVSISLNDIQEFFPEMQRQTGFYYQSIAKEKFLNFSNQLGKGQIYNLHLRDGIELYLQDWNLEENLIIKANTKYSSLGLGFCLSGNLEAEVIGSKVDLSLTAGRNLLLHSNAYKATMEIPARQNLFLVEMSIDSQIIKSIVEDECEQIDYSLQSLIECQDSKIYAWSGITNPAMKIALNQIINCPYKNLTKHFYLESKTLELVSLKLAELTDSKTENKIYKKLRADEVERIYFARDVLISNLENPPSLLSLAQIVGLNEHKLKLGFRQVFGTTAFGYLHQYKMERSRLLLESGLMNVTEVASAVGYSNFSHFTAAFKRKFGINPSALKSRF